MASLKGSAILFSEMTPPDGAQRHFNQWYFEHHMPSHVYGVPGFLSGQRYRDGSRYLAIYELAATSTLSDPEYRSRKYTPDTPTRTMLSQVSGFTRYVCAETDMLLCRGYSEDEGLGAFVVVAEFHAGPVPLDRLTEQPEWRLSRSFEIEAADPDPYRHMNLHYFDGPTMEPRAGQAQRIVRYELFGKRYHKGEPGADSFVPPIDN